MNKLKRLMGRLIYVFLALPALLGGMALMSVRPWALSPNRYKALVEDRRFAAVLSSPDLRGAVPETMEAGGLKLSGPAAVGALQGSLDPKLVSDMFIGGIDYFFESLKAGRPSIALDLKPIKDSLSSSADALAKDYLSIAATLPPSDPTAASAEAIADVAAEAAIASASDGEPGKALAIPATMDPKMLSAIIAQSASRLPDTLKPASPAQGQPEGDTTELQLGSMKLEDIQLGLTQGSIWIGLVGLGLAVASAFISETELRKRLGALGSRLTGPGTAFTILGLLPVMINPSAVAGKEAGSVLSSFPALSEYARFVTQNLFGGFLWVGLAVLGAGVALTVAKHAIPPSEDLEDLEEGQEL